VDDANHATDCALVELDQPSASGAVRHERRLQGGAQRALVLLRQAQRAVGGAAVAGRDPMPRGGRSARRDVVVEGDVGVAKVGCNSRHVDGLEGRHRCVHQRRRKHRRSRRAPPVQVERDLRQGYISERRHVQQRSRPVGALDDNVRQRAREPRANNAMRVRRDVANTPSGRSTTTTTTTSTAVRGTRSVPCIQRPTR
jgi:hypothetical protein